MKIKKILLIGLGNMGHAHLSSFSGKKKFKFYIYDKYLSLNKATKKICDLNINAKIIHEWLTNTF